MAMACGGSTEQMADDGVALRASALHGSTQQMCDGDDAGSCGSDCDCKGEEKAKAGPPRTTFTVGGKKPAQIKVPHENAGA
jgi:hypothetical protein